MVSNMLSDFVSNIVSSAGQQLRLIFKRDEDLEKIRQTLTTVKDFILDAEEKQESDLALKEWIIQVEDVVYDADDLLDEIDHEILGEKVRAQGQEPGVHTRKKHLRYLDLSSNNKMKVLPDTTTKLHHLQTLLLKYCTRLEELPRDIQHLISLEYLNVDDCQALKYLSKGLGELTLLQRLDRFIVNSVEESFSTAATLNELRDLNGLRNNLTIEHLGKVRNVELESKEVNLKRKKRLQSLKLCWRSSLHWSPSSPATVASEKDESLLNNLEPHPNLKELKVFDYGRARFSSWLSSLTNLVKLTIACFWNCQHLPPLDHFSSLKSLTLYRSNAFKHLPTLDHLSSLESLSLTGLRALEHLPPLDHLSSLKYLVLEELNALEYVADSFPLPCSTSRKPFFPSLKKLKIEFCDNLKGWWRTKNENQGSTTELPCFPCLSKIDISKCPNLTSMPLFPSLDQDLTLWGTSVRPLQQTLKMKMTEASMTSEEASSSSGST
ncbi:hypothetical protein POUND7_006876 [Theobroma cacao]